MSTDAVASPVVEIDYSQFITQDDEPLDGFFQERQQRLLTEILYASWRPPGPPRQWHAAANVGVFYAVRSPAIVPDVFLAVGVPGPGDLTTKQGESYFIWDQGKPPDVVVEVVSKTPGGEDGEKLDRYGQIGVPWYVIYDADRRLSDEPLRVFERRPRGLTPTADRLYPELDLGVTVWYGEYEGMERDWLRWTDATGRLLPAKWEVAEANKERADAATERATLEHLRAEQVTKQRDEARAEADRARAEADRLAALLRKAGIDPDQK